MSDNRGRYPKWVHKFVGPQQRAKRVNGNYYLYELVSDGMGGKKEQYVGVIEPQGVRHKKEERISFGKWAVYEYGGSKALLELCSAKWKSMRGSEWMLDLLCLISEVTPCSYLLRQGVPEGRNLHLAKKNLNAHLKKEHGVTMEQLFANLGGIMLLVHSETEEKSLSQATEEQLFYARQLGVKLEVL